MLIYNFMLHGAAMREINEIKDPNELKKVIEVLLKKNPIVDDELEKAERILQDQNKLIKELTAKLAVTMEQADVGGARSFALTSELLKKSISDFMKYQDFLGVICETDLFEGHREVQARFLSDAMDNMPEDDVEHSLDMTDQIVENIRKIFEPSNNGMEGGTMACENSGQDSSSTNVQQEDARQDNASRKINSREDNAPKNSLKKQRKRKMDMTCHAANSKFFKKMKFNSMPLKELKVTLSDFMLEDDVNCNPYVTKYKQSCTSLKEGENYTANPIADKKAEANDPDNLVADEKVEDNDTINKVADQNEAANDTNPVVPNEIGETSETFNHVTDKKEANDAVSAVAKEKETKVAAEKAEANIDEKEVKDALNPVHEKDKNDAFNSLDEKEVNVIVTIIDEELNNALNPVDEKEASVIVPITDEKNGNDGVNIIEDKKDYPGISFFPVTDRKKTNSTVNRLMDEKAEVSVTVNSLKNKNAGKNENVTPVAGEKAVASDTVNPVLDGNTAASDMDNDDEFKMELEIITLD